MPTTQCAFTNCTNGSYRLRQWKKSICNTHNILHSVCECLPPFVLYPFPQDPNLRLKWTNLVNRVETNPEMPAGKWQPRGYSRVCSIHFVGGQQTIENPLPTLNLPYTLTPNARMQPRKARRRCSPVSTPQGKDDRLPQPPSRSVKRKTLQLQAPSKKRRKLDENFADDEKDKTCAESTENEKDTFNCDSCSQKDIEISELKQRLSTKQNTFANLIQTDKDVLLYTGLPSLAVLELLFEYVEPKVSQMSLWHGQSAAKKRETPKKNTQGKFGRIRKLSRKDEMLMALMKLKLGLTNLYLSRVFNVSEAVVSTVFTTWVKVLAAVLKHSIQLPTAEIVAANLPKSFKNRNVNVRGILDCTEFFIDRPRDLRNQSSTWSDYKKHNTIKVLIVITPRGKIAFVSKAYTGRTSDKQITQQSGFLDLVEPYDRYMADRGFPIANELLERRAELIIPPGRRGRGQMTASDVRKTKCIANLRIHVERAIERIKRFKILKNTLPVALLPLADDMITACAGLCNLLPALVN